MSRSSAPEAQRAHCERQVFEVRDVSDVTGFPEMMDGRIKTLHPRIHGALLALRDNPEHLAAMREHGIEPIDLVVVNLYPFQETVARKDTTLEEAIEQIDIGGPAMIRSAAKNFRDVAVVVAPETYEDVLQELRSNDGALSLFTRKRLALGAFTNTFTYDTHISSYLLSIAYPGPPEFRTRAARWNRSPHRLHSYLDKRTDLRYGENPHQNAALYTIDDSEELNLNQGVAGTELLSGKEMSFNNYVDADAAWQLVCDFEETACAIIKHTNPAGVGLGVTAEEAYRKALATDPVSAFGGIVAFNCSVDEAAARSVIEIFTEVVIAPDYDEKALEVLQTKKNLRVLRAETAAQVEGLEYKQISGGMLVQTRDTHRLSRRLTLKSLPNVSQPKKK